MTRTARPTQALAIAGRTALGWAPGVVGLLVVGQVAAYGANTRLLGVVAAIANLVVAAAILARVEARSRFWAKARWPLSAFALALAWAALPAILPAFLAGPLHIGVRPAPDLFVPELAKAIGNVALLTASAAIAYSRRTARDMVGALAWCAGGYCALLLVLPGLWTTRFDGVARFTATVGNWNAAGVFFAMAGLLAAACIAPGPARTGIAPGAARTRMAYARGAAAAALAATCVVLCALTQSRVAFGMMAAAGFAMAVAAAIRARGGQGRYRGLAAIVAVAALIGLAASIGSEAIFSRYLASAADGESRIAIIDHYFAMSMQSPLWGHGLGSFFDVNEQGLTNATVARYWSFGAAHNAPIQIAIEVGWPGLVLLALAIGLIARRILGQGIVGRGIDRWTMAALAALSVLVGASMIDIAWNVPGLASLGCVLFGTGWGAALARVPVHQA